jgi:thiamine biosynthesis lipoprotein
MAKDATTAEVLSKGVFILGPDRGLPLVERTEGAGAVIVDAANKVHVSKRLDGKVRFLSLPSP